MKVDHPGKAVWVIFESDHNDFKKGDRVLMLGASYVELAEKEIVKLDASQHENGKLPINKEKK